MIRWLFRWVCSRISNILPILLDIIIAYNYREMNKLLVKKNDKKQEILPITQFQGYYEFLSIEYPAWVYYEGFIYPSVTTAFQAARTNDVVIRRKISQIKDQDQFKKIAAQIVNSADWPQRRLKVMQKLNRDKFKRNKQLGLKLFATQSRMLCNGYLRGGDAEVFWGVIQKGEKLQGLNTLGSILTTIRQQIQSGIDSFEWVKDQNVEPSEVLWPEANLVVRKQGQFVDDILLLGKGSFLLGSAEQNDFKLQHGSISKFHASIYFSTDMQVVLVDLNSTHGTVVARVQTEIKLQPLRPQSLESGDVITFGKSSRSYTVHFSYELVQQRIAKRQLQQQAQLKRIEQIKGLQGGKTQNQVMQRNMIKSLLELKRHSCLYVENISRGLTYMDIRNIFNSYGPVKNVRINVDQKTGRYMGSAIITFDQITKIANVLQNIQKEPVKYQHKIVPVTTEEAEKIIETFASKQVLQQKKRERDERQSHTDRGRLIRQKRHGSRRSSSQSRSRDGSRSRSSSYSSSSSSYSSSSRWSRARPPRHDK